MADTTPRSAPDPDVKAGEWPPAPIPGPTRPPPPSLPGARSTVHKPHGRRVTTSAHEDI